MSKVKMQIRDTDLAKAETALRRAAARAKKIAEETHTPLVVFEGGRVVKKFPDKKRGNRSKLLEAS
ncbi:MAG: hypothetical protein QME44_04780 [Thermodesulfobacteriota bacterium]|nr:hypothetical protein [Thermodesulfobacteriota bacterium]